ncbi:MAG: glycosyltransferase family 39 protein [Nitrospira sp.]
MSRSGEQVSVGSVSHEQESAVPSWWEADSHRYVQVLVLALVSGWAYFANLHLSLLEGSEGLYAGIAGEMARRGEFFDLTYQGIPYFNKPPLFFWLLNFSTSIWGDHEIALRLPGSLAAVGTILLTYVLGSQLMSSRAGFWAAMVVATSHVFLWYGRRVLFDSTLTCLVTLALFAWIQVQILGRSSRWYLVTFLSMALGAMLKEMHGFFLPLLIMVLYAVIQRDARMVRDKFFWIGLAGAIALLSWYAQLLSGGYQHHFLLESAIKSVWNSGLSGAAGTSKDGHPIYWYLGMMWADFFPWCALLPSALVLLWRQRPLRSHQTELVLLVWVLGLFTAFSLATLKREPYLTTLVPGIGLMIGYFYHRSCQSLDASGTMSPLLRMFLVILALVFIGGMFFGGTPLRRRWLVSAPVASPVFVMIMVSLAGTLLYAAITARLQLALRMVGLLAAAYVVLVVNYVFPAIDEAASPRKATEYIKSMAKEAGPPMFLFIPGWPKNEDAVYYLKRDTVVRDLRDEDALYHAARTQGPIRIITEESHMVSLQRQTGLVVETMQEFLQPGRKHLYLLSVQAKN